MHLTGRPLWWLFARSRGLATLAIGAAAILVLALTIPVDPVLVPLDDSRAVFIGQSPGLVAGALWSMYIASTMPELERAAEGRLLRRLRLGWFAFGTAIFVAIGAGGALARELPPVFAALGARTTLLALGLGTACGLLLPRSVAWVPLLGYTALCWLLGTSDELATPRWWALPHHLLDAGWVLGIAVAVWLGTGAWFVTGRARGSRPE